MAKRGTVQLDPKDRADILRALSEVQGAGAVLGEQARRMLRLKRAYSEKHWGHPGYRAARKLAMPDVSEGVEVLGSLVEISYLTTKGRGRDAEIFEHAFSPPYPLLGVAPDGKRQGLVILRDHSRYTVNVRGIVG